MSALRGDCSICDEGEKMIVARITLTDGDSVVQDSIDVCQECMDENSYISIQAYQGRLVQSN